MNSFVLFFGASVLGTVLLLSLYQQLGGGKIYFLKRQGGLLAALVALILISLVYWQGNSWEILLKDYWSIIVGALIVIGGGILDEKKDLPPFFQFFYQGLAALVLLGAGDTINHIQLPFLGLVALPFWLNYFFSFFWIVLLMNAFNWFDGLDGLASGVGAIGFLTLFFLGLTPIVAQAGTAGIAIICTGAILGLLFFNFYPAKTYLGSVGSSFFGFMLALLAIYAGGKVAAAALVMGVPIIDLFYVIFARLRNGQKPWVGGDRRHIHYRLLDAGWSEKKIVILMYGLSVISGIIALSLQTGLKLTGLIMLGAVVALILLRTNKWQEKKSKKL